MSIRKNEDWILGVNSRLPKDISICWASQVPHFFNARSSAIARFYRYIIYNCSIRSAFLENKVLYFYKNLDAIKMNNAGQYLIGENNFSSFRSSKCQSTTPWRNLLYIKVFRIDKYIILDFLANAFLHNMVRNIVGSLIEVGRGKKKENWIKKLLFYKKRELAGATVKPSGLYLIKIFYPKVFNLP